MAPAAKNVDHASVVESARRARIVCARSDINTFLELVLKDEQHGCGIEQGQCHVEWHEACDQHDRVILYSHIESGKAVPLDTPIPTPTGWSTMGELKVGDTVFGADGLPHKVTWCSPVQYGRDVFEVVFDDGVTELADADHNWLAWSIDDLAVHGSGKPRVVTTKEMFARVHRVGPEKRKQAKWHVPVAAPVEYPEAALDVHPYVLGAWLGDGETATAMLTVHEKDRMIADRCIELEGGRCGKWHRHKEKPQVFKINIGGDDDKHTNHDPTRLRARLRKLGVLGNKHIPLAYLTASVAQRRELLAGLIDTDGHVSGDGKGRVEFTSTIQALAEGVIELVRSLGFTATCAKGTAQLNGRVVGDKWRVAWTPHEAVCKLPRKLTRQRLDGDRRWTRHRAVIDVHQVESRPVKCITVDSKDHTYLMGHAYTVTHNSQQMAVGRILFELGRNPELRVAIVSNTFLQAKKAVDAIAKYIEEDEHLHTVFPHLVPGSPWIAGAITVKRKITKRDPSVRAVGVHGSILGARLDLVILDDILDYENTQSPRSRQDVWDWYHSTIAGRLTAGGRVIAIGTAWHPDDILHRFAAQPRWYCMRYPVEDADGNPMWEEQWPRDRIALKREELGPLEFARQMLCQARDDAEARFQRPWIDQCLAEGAGCQPASSAVDFFRKHPTLSPPGWFTAEHPELADALDVLRRMDLNVGGQFFTGVDLGVQKHSNADETVLFTIFVHAMTNKRQVVEVLAGKWTGPEIVRNIISVNKRFNSIVLVENNAAQHFILQFALDEGGVIPVLPYTTGRNKTNPLLGIEALAAEFANAGWMIPSKGGKPLCENMGKWIQEMLFYDPGGHTGDRLMASWFARELARRAATKATRVGTKVLG